MADYDIILVGGGVANTMLVLELLRHKYKGKILIVDKGKHTNNRDWDDPNDISFGFPLGAGMTSDCKIVVSEESGGYLCSVIGNTAFYSGASSFIYHLSMFLGNEMVRNSFIKATTPDWVKHSNFDILNNDVYHLGSDYGRVLSKEIVKRVSKANNVTIVYNTEVSSVDIEKGEVSFNNGVFYGRHVVVGVGRSGARLVESFIDKSQLIKVSYPAHLGCRVEIKHTFVKKHTDASYDFKYTLPTEWGSVRSHCVAPQGKVIIEKSMGVSLLNGGSNKDKKTDRTNFAVMCSLDNLGKNALDDVMAWARKINHYYLSFNGILWLNWELLYSLNTQQLLGESIFWSLVAWLQEFSKITPEFKENVKIGFPEIKTYSSTVKLQSDLKISGKVYLVGDCSGLTRGIYQSAISGIHVADHLLWR